jgi:hypothetical protein
VQGQSGSDWTAGQPEQQTTMLHQICHVGRSCARRRHHGGSGSEDMYNNFEYIALLGNEERALANYTLKSWLLQH